MRNKHKTEITEFINLHKDSQVIRFTQKCLPDSIIAGRIVKTEIFYFYNFFC